MRLLTEQMHAKHAYVTDPKRGSLLSFCADRATCLPCHAGPESRYQRGVQADATFASQCQRCHTGTVLQNGGQLRFACAFTAAGNKRRAANQTFAVQPGSPGAGTSPFRPGIGHGGMKCATRFFRVRLQP